MIQSLAHRGTVNDVVAQYGQVIVDECHHVPAASFERVLAEVKARFVVGLTATPHRRDGLHPIIEMQLGPTRFTIDARSLSFRQLDNTVWCDITRREMSYFFGKPPIFCSFASSVERSCAGAFASFARSFCRFSFR
jgi:hypothetical protein